MATIIQYSLVALGIGVVVATGVPICEGGFKEALAQKATKTFEPKLDCRHEDDLSEMDHMFCAEADAKAADAKLQTTYDTLMGKIEDGDKDRLRRTERAWIAFRDAECEFQTGGDTHNSFWQRLVLECRIKMADKRLKALQDQLQCQSWDESCPAK